MKLFCQNNHMFPKDNIVYFLYDYDFESNRDYDINKIYCEICMLKMFKESDLSKYLEIMYKIPKDEVFVEIKRVNKKRLKVHDSEYIEYVIDKFQLNKENLLEEVQNRFGDYELFRMFLKGEYSQ